MINEQKSRRIIGEYYEKHKKDIYPLLKDRGIQDPKSAFIETTLKREIVLGLSPEKAIKSLMRTEVFMTKAELFARNINSYIKSDKMLYEQWRKWTRHQKIIWENFEYLGHNKYVYHTKTKDIYIDVNNSPKQILMYYDDLVEKKKRLKEMETQNVKA